MLPETPPAPPSAPPMLPTVEGQGSLHPWMMALLVVLGMGLISAGLAQRKGYNPLVWVLAGGAIAWPFLAVLPSISTTAPLTQETLQARNRGNLLGAGLSVFSVFIGLALWILWKGR